MYLRAYLKLVSNHVMLEKPAIFSIGGFSLNLKDGKKIMFDWCESGAGFEINKDGYGEFDVWLRDFDENFFIESNIGDNSVSIDEVSAKFFTEDSVLKEIFYEAYMDETEDPLIPFKVTEFRLSGDKDSAEFSKEQLDEYDKNYAIWRDQNAS